MVTPTSWVNPMGKRRGRARLIRTQTLQEENKHAMLMRWFQDGWQVRTLDKSIRVIPGRVMQKSCRRHTGGGLRCGWGCGTDECRQMLGTPLKPGAVHKSNPRAIDRYTSNNTQTREKRSGGGQVEGLLGALPSSPAMPPGGFGADTTSNSPRDGNIPNIIHGCKSAQSIQTPIK